MQYLAVIERWEKEYARRIEDMTESMADKIIADAVAATMPPIRTLAAPATAVDVAHTYAEFAGVCPMTGLPDNYHLVIRYRTGKAMPELKSLRDYLLAFRQLPITHEHVAQKLAAELTGLLGVPVHISLTAAVRGGITTTVEAVVGKEGLRAAPDGSSSAPGALPR